MEFGHAYCQCTVKRTLCKFICIFLRFIVFTMDFRILNMFPRILKSEKGFLRIGKTVNSYGPLSGSRPCGGGTAHGRNRPYQPATAA
jgi:hypothetical protein